MARQKSRTRLLADALDQARRAQQSLYEIDLRTTRGDLRDSLREARVANETAIEYIGAALEQDVPASRPSLRAARA